MNQPKMAAGIKQRKEKVKCTIGLKHVLNTARCDHGKEDS